MRARIMQGGEMWGELVARCGMGRSGVTRGAEKIPPPPPFQKMMLGDDGSSRFGRKSDERLHVCRFAVGFGGDGSLPGSSDQIKSDFVESQGERRIGFSKYGTWFRGYEEDDLAPSAHSVRHQDRHIS